MTPGRRAYELFVREAPGGAMLPSWEALPVEAHAPWEKVAALAASAPHQDARVEDAIRKALALGAELAKGVVPAGVLLQVRLVLERVVREALHAVGFDTGHVVVSADKGADVTFEIEP